MPRKAVITGKSQSYCDNRYIVNMERRKCSTYVVYRTISRRIADAFLMFLSVSRLNIDHRHNIWDEIAVVNPYITLSTVDSIIS